MTREPDEQPVDLLRHAEDLEEGNWRPVMAALGGPLPVADSAELVDLAVCLRHLARSMRFHCSTGNVPAARTQLEKAAVLLSGDPHVRPWLGPKPARGWELSWLRWVITRLVLRELEDADALRVIFSQLRAGRDELVYAWIEYESWVSRDPYTTRVHPRDAELLGLEGDAYCRFRQANRLDMCARATYLRQDARVRTGTVAVRTWQRNGGPARIYEDALDTLAKEPLSRSHAEWPVRLGRRRAHEDASRFVADTT